MIVDHELMKRIEEAIVAERSAFAEGMSARLPDSGASWLPVAGGRAIFTGADFFTNRVIAMGLDEPVCRRDMERVEAFYAERGVAAEIEIASMVHRSLLRLLGQFDYHIMRFRNIYAQMLRNRKASGGDSSARAAELETYVVDALTADDWSTILLDGFGYTTAADRKRVAVWNQMVYRLPGVTALVAIVNGQPVGAASVMLLGTNAVLGGAATLPAFRCQGVQRRLIDARLAVAAKAGCELAVITADPGSSSGRNAERSGFALVCNHISMRASGER